MKVSVRERLRLLSSRRYAEVQRAPQHPLEIETLQLRDEELRQEEVEQEASAPVRRCRRRSSKLGIGTAQRDWKGEPA